MLLQVPAALLALIACHFHLVTPTSTSTIEHPFLLPFGPKHNDAFVDKGSDKCSRGQLLSKQFLFGGQPMNQIFVCNDVYVDFLARSNMDKPQDFDSSLTPIISLALHDHEIEDGLFDYMCLQSNQHYPWISGIYDYDWEDICAFFHRADEFATWEYAVDLVKHHPGYNDVNDQIIYAWNAQSIPRALVNITFDDELTIQLMGEDVRPFVNLAANTFRREISNQTDFDAIDSLINQQHEGFSSNWGYVATWYKIMDNDMETAYFNSFQLVLACYFNDDPTALEDRCFAIMEYYEINYTLEQGNDMHMAAGLKNPSVGLRYTFPGFATAEAVHYQYSSNFGVPGIWVFELNQYPDAESLSVDTHFMAPFVGIHDDPNVCPDAMVSTTMISMFSSNNLLSFGPCPFIGSMAGLVKFHFKGTFQKVLDARPFEEQYLNYSLVQVPPIWGVNEEVELRVTLDDVTVGGPYMFYFSAPGQTAGDTTGMLTTEKMADKVVVSWDGLDLPDGFVIIQVLIATSSDHVDGFHVDDTLTSVHQVNVTSASSFDYTGTVGYLTVFKMISFQFQELAIGYVFGDRDSSTNCDSWAASDVAINTVSLCSSNIEHIYPCPKFPEMLIGSPFNGSFEQSDSWWANEEINRGVTGWHFDLCCSDNDPDKRMTLKNQGICPETNCELNPGASFCIQSPPAICEASLPYPRMITNQCCYSQEGDLIVDATSGGAGSLNAQRQSMNNIIAHYDQDIQSKSLCCIEETDKCSVFSTVRAPSIGEYHGSMIISSSFGGHYINANGSHFHFVGLGVYNLATVEFPTTSAITPTRSGMITIQISTRPYGESSVISGFVLKDSMYKIELFRLDDVTTAFFVNDVMTVFPYLPYKVGDFEIENNMGVDSTFTIRDLRTGMVVSASVISKFLSLYVAVPSFLDDIEISGLLGQSDHPTFYVDAQNLTAQHVSDLHTYLEGEYKLSSQSDWLFNTMAHALIAADIASAPDSFNYEVPLTAYESFSTACNGDENCIADSHFTGDDANVAQAYAAATLLKVPGLQSEPFSELFRAYNTPVDDPEDTTDSAARMSIVWQLTAGCVLVAVSWFKM